MADEGWVRIYHPDQVDHVPDPDEPDDSNLWATVTHEAFNLVWRKHGYVDLDEAAEAVLAEDMPEKASARIAWIDEDPTLAVIRAKTALADEEARGDAGRTSVIEHAESVIEESTSAEDETAPDDTTPEE